MGTRSDVGIAIKNDVYDQLSVRTKLFLQEHFSQEAHIEDPPGFGEGTENLGGRLFHVSNIKWYPDFSEIGRIYEELDKIDEMGESYLILEGCYEYPESDENQAGCWWDNPWDLFRNVCVSVDYHL